jgi:hypothetical protein
MTKQVQLRRGTSAEHATFVGAVGELTIDTTLDVAIVHDGSKVGGHPLVGTASTQQIVNKTSIGINTGIPQFPLTVIGDASISGNLDIRSMNVVAFATTNRNGSISGFTTNIIVNSFDSVVSIESGLFSGYLVEIDTEVFGTLVTLGTNFSATITSLGDGFIGLSTTFDAGQLAFQGNFETIESNIISGISTSIFGEILVNYPNIPIEVRGPYIGAGTTIIEIGVDSITISNVATNPYDGTIIVFGNTTEGSFVISGIDTSGILLGSNVEDDNFPDGATVVSIGINQVTVDQEANSTVIGNLFLFSFDEEFEAAPQSLELGFIISDLGSGQINSEVLETSTISANTAILDTASVNLLSVDTGIFTGITIGTAFIDQNAIIQNATIFTSSLDNAYINSGIITSATIDNVVIGVSTVTTAGISSARVDNFFATSGIVTTAGISSARVDDLYVTSGIITSAGISSARVDNFFATSGIVTTAGITSARVEDLYVTSGIITSAGISSARVDNFFATSGIVTTAGISSARVDNFFATSGIVTTAGISSARVDDLYANSGIITSATIDNVVIGVSTVTTAGISSARVDDLYANSGIITSATIDNVVIGVSTVTTATVTTATIDNAVIGVSTVTTAGIDNASIDQLRVNVGLITDAYINSGIITSATIDNAVIGVSTVTTAGITSARVEDLYVTSGIITSATIDNVVIGVSTVTTATVTTAGISSARVDNFFATSGIVTTAGISSARVDDLYVNSGIITSAGISSARVDDLYVNSGIITSATIDNAVIGVSTVTSATINNAVIGVSTVTTAGISSARVDNAYINSGIVTTAGISSARVDNFFATSGIVTTAGISSARVDNFFATSGIVTSAGISSARVDNFFATSGIVTSAGISSARVDNFFATSGIITSATINNAVIGVSTVTTAGIDNASIDQLRVNVGLITDAYINSGIITSVGITTASIDQLRVNVGLITDAYINSGIITSLLVSGISTFSSNVDFSDEISLGDNKSIKLGVSTDLQIVHSTFGAPNNRNRIISNLTGNTYGLIIETAEGNITLSKGDPLFGDGQTMANFIPDGSVELYFNNSKKFQTIGTGVSISGLTSTTDLQSTTAIIGQAYISSGIITSSFINSANANIGDASINVGVITNAYIKSGIITNINFDYANSSGIATIGNVVIGGGTTTLVVDGNARITGILTIGNSSVTINSKNISGVQTYSGQVGIFTNVQIAGFNTSTNIKTNVTLKTSSAGIATNYELILPPSLGKFGQVLSLDSSGRLGFTTSQGQFENRYFVSAKSGDDNNDGKTLPVKTIRRAAQLASFDSFIIPGNRFLDAGDLLEANKDFIAAEVVAYVEFNFEDISTRLPDYNRATCIRDIKFLLDAIIYDIRFGGNSKSVEAGFAYWDTLPDPDVSYLAGEEEEAIFAFEYLKFIGQYVINNQSPPTLYQFPIVEDQKFDFTIIQDPENTNGNYFHKSKDARNLIVGNRQEIIDKSLASVALAATTGFYFPGEEETNERSRFYDSYKLIQINRQEIIDYAWDATVNEYPGISDTETKCKRDLGYFVDAVSTDVFTGGNNYVRSFVGFYFDSVGNPTSNGLLGEEIESVYAFEEAKVGMSSAICNLLTNQDLTITADPVTGFNTDPDSCANVRSTISTLVGIVTSVISAGSTAGIGTTTNYGFFLVNSEFNVSSFVGIGTTNVVGGRKCARDLGYIVDAVAQDISYGSNKHIIYATKKYFDGAGEARTDGLEGEEVISGYAFTSLAFYAKKAVTNQLNYQDLTIISPPGIGTNIGDSVCTTTQATIHNLVGILTTAVLSGSLSEVPSVNLGITDCADVRSALVNYVGIITTIAGLGTEFSPEKTFPQTISKPVAIFVEAAEYIEDNPIILYDDIAVIGDNLRNTIIRPANNKKDLFRVRNGVYLTGFAMKDFVDPAGIPQSTFDFAVSFDDPLDPFTSRIGYATKNDKPIISRSPYIQNCSIISFLGANGILVDGNKVQSPNTPILKAESENPVEGDQPEQGKSMVAAAFTMISFGGIGWRTINDGYAQVVSCFQIFCNVASLCQSGGYLSITNSAVNFGNISLRAVGFSRKSFAFDRGTIAATGVAAGTQTLKAVGYGRSDVENYILRFFNDQNVDTTSSFKPLLIQSEFDSAVSVGITAGVFNILTHPFVNGDLVVYSGDEQSIPPRIIGGLVNDNQYYVEYIDSNSFKLYEDDDFKLPVVLTSTSSGIHTFTKSPQEFFVKDLINTGTHNSYQKLTLAGIGNTANFVSGRLVTQTLSSGTAIGIALTYNNDNRELIVGLELSGGTRRQFRVTDGTDLTISDHSTEPISIGITNVVGISSYWTIEFKVDSTDDSTIIQNIGSLPETFKLHLNRPSIINASSHTWEYSGSGTDYNALPENGGQSNPETEQVSERGGRVYSSGTNELGDFKIGKSITAFNRTGNIIFNNTVTIGELDSLRLSLSGGIAVEEFSSDIDLGDNELGGPKNNRVSTQLAVRSFLSNRLGGFIDKSISTNPVPGAIVQLNATGQLNVDLVPPRSVNYYKVPNDGGRLQLVNYIPATNLNAGDTVVEPSAPFVLISDTVSQYLILNNDTIYNFEQGDTVVSIVSAGGAQGIVTSPPYIGVATDTVESGVGYGTTGLVRGVPLTLTSLVGGSGYNTAGIYTGVRLDPATGIGTGISATITVSAGGTVSNVAIDTGGFKFAVGNTLTLNDPTPIGGRTGGSNFTVNVGSVETRLYLKLATGQKFPGSAVLSDYISDRNAVAISTNIGIGSTVSFVPTDISVDGDVDFVNDRIVVGDGHEFADGDPVIYRNNGGVSITDLTDSFTYYIKTVGVSSVQLFTTYGLVTIKSLTSSGTGTHSLSRVGVNTFTNQITFVNHGFTQGDPVLVSGNTPIGISTGDFYFVGSVTQNSFTLHNTRSQSLTSINGLLLSTISLAGGTINDAVGIMTLTKQNIEYSSTINTSSSEEENWSLLSTGTLDAANIVSGIFSPSRLGVGDANDEVFLSGDSSYKKVVTSVGIGSTQPISATSTSADFGVGFTTYYGDVNLTVNRVQTSVDEFSLLGVARFKSSTFIIGSDGAVSIKNSTNGDIDAATLGAQVPSYYLDLANSVGNVPIARGGTGLSAIPSVGFMALGNGSGYTLTGDPTFAGIVGAGFTVLGNKDISFGNGTWTGEKAAKIQYSGNNLFNQFTGSWIARNSTGANVFTINNNGNTVCSGIITATRLSSTVATGTAPLTVTSTTQVSNLNASLLQGFETATSNTINTIVRRDASGNFSAGAITASGLTLNGNGSTTSAQLSFSGSTNNWITFGINGVAAPAFTTRSLGTKIVLYTGLSVSAVDYAFGIESSTLWSSVPTTAQQFRWYGGTTLAATLTGAGVFTAVGTIQGTRLISTIATGTAPLTVTSTTQVSNLNASLLQGFVTATINTVNTIVRRDASGNFSAGTITATTFTGSLSGTLTRGTYLTGNNYNGSANTTWNVDATSANTADKVVARDASGNFSAGTITATLSGTATNATNTGITNNTTTNATYYPTFVSAITGNLPQTVSSTKLTFNPSTGRLTVTSIAATLANTLTLNTSGTGLSGSTTYNNSGAVTFTVTSNATSANTAGTIVARDGSGNFTAGTITVTTLVGSLTNTLTLNTSGTGLSGSTTYNNSGAATFTVTSNATSANTVSTIVARDASGNFSAGTITAALSGNSSSATTTAITNNTTTNATYYPTFVSATSGNLAQTISSTKLTFNPSTGRLTVTSIAATLANTLTLNTSGTGLSGSTTYNNSGAATFTVTSNATSANTAGAIVARDGSGNFTAGTITATLNGNAGSVTNGVYTIGNQTIGGIKTFSNNIFLANNTSLRQASTSTWSGNPGSGVGKIEYHNNRWYIVAGSNSTELVRIRRDGADIVNISNTGVYSGSIAGNAATVTNGVYLTGTQTITGIKYFQSNLGTTSGTLSNPPLQAYSTATNSAFMAFHRGGSFAVNFGLDSDNVLRIGGWSAAANRWQLDMSGNMTAAGTVTANSDIKLKENISTIENALEKTLQLRGVEFDRIDSGEHQIGVIAQEIEEVIPFLVREDSSGTKSVAYGNITALLIEAIKDQQKQINTLKKEIEGLKN